MAYPFQPCPDISFKPVHRNPAQTKIRLPEFHLFIESCRIERLNGNRSATCRNRCFKCVGRMNSTSSERSATSCCFPYMIFFKSSRISTCWLSALVRMILAFDNPARSSPAGHSDCAQDRDWGVIRKWNRGRRLHLAQHKHAADLETSTVSPGSKGMSMLPAAVGRRRGQP